MKTLACKRLHPHHLHALLDLLVLAAHGPQLLVVLVLRVLRRHHPLLRAIAHNIAELAGLSWCSVVEGK